MGSTDDSFQGSSPAKKKLEFGSDEEVDQLEEEFGDNDLTVLDSEDIDKERDEEGPAVNLENSKKSKPMELKVTPSMDIQGARARNHSECSNDSLRSPSLDSTKRRRTVSGSSPIQNFIFPGIPASPPKFIALEDVMKAAQGVSNMVLAHEIAVDKNFKLEKLKPPENSLEKRVRDTMHRAFWDFLKEQLSEDPPVYSQAFILLSEVRDNLVEITLPHHSRLRQEIADKFDVPLIKQQAEHGTLNFIEYSQYVLSIMARLCAPVRDDTIKTLMNETDVVKVFKGVMETLDLMRLDMANFTIQQIRPTIIAQSVEYERKKFAEFLSSQNDGLELTRGWLCSHIKPEDCEIQDEMMRLKMVSNVLSRAYVSLLFWKDEKLLPETVVLDGGRILDLRDRLIQICMMGAMILVALSSLGPLLVESDALKMKIKKSICIIMDSAGTEKETYDLVENVTEQIIKDISDHLVEYEKPPLAPSAVMALKAQLIEIKNPEQRIRTLITKRATEFIGSLLNATAARPVQLPPGLSTLQEELGHVCGTLIPLVSHNRAVFGEYYSDIISIHIKGVNTMRDDLPKCEENND